MIKVTKDAEAEGSEVKKLSTEKHMILTQVDVFQAGLDTTATTMLRVIAYLVNYPEVQEKIQQKINNVIGRIGCRHFKTKAIYRTSEPW